MSSGNKHIAKLKVRDNIHQESENNQVKKNIKIAGTDIGMMSGDQMTNSEAVAKHGKFMKTIGAKC